MDFDFSNIYRLCLSSIYDLACLFVLFMQQRNSEMESIKNSRCIIYSAQWIVFIQFVYAVCSSVNCENIEIINNSTSQIARNEQTA